MMRLINEIQFLFLIQCEGRLDLVVVFVRRTFLSSALIHTFQLNQSSDEPSRLLAPSFETNGYIPLTSYRIELKTDCAREFNRIQQGKRSG